MMSTTGRLSFDSGYTTNVSTLRPSCLTLTHSRCRGDFSTRSLAHSWATTPGARKRAAKTDREAHLLITVETSGPVGRARGCDGGIVEGRVKEVKKEGSRELRQALGHEGLGHFEDVFIVGLLGEQRARFFVNQEGDVAVQLQRRSGDRGGHRSLDGLGNGIGFERA